MKTLTRKREKGGRNERLSRLRVDSTRKRRVRASGTALA